MELNGFLGRQPRRQFFRGLLTTVTGAAALLFAKRRRAVAKTDPEPEQGPILYRRTEEAERYYRTLYR